MSILGIAVVVVILGGAFGCVGIGFLLGYAKNTAYCEHLGRKIRELEHKLAKYEGDDAIYPDSDWWQNN